MTSIIFCFELMTIGTFGLNGIVVLIEQKSEHLILAFAALSIGVGGFCIAYINDKLKEKVH